MIRASIAYAESAEKALSILEYRPDLGADYLALADEVLARIGREDARGASSARPATRSEGFPDGTRPGMGIRVFHCDDSEAFTRLVSFWLAEHDDIEHVGPPTPPTRRSPRCRSRRGRGPARHARPAGRRLAAARGPRGGARARRVIVYSGYVG